MLLATVAIGLLGYLAYKSTARPDNFPPGPWNLPLVGYLPFLGSRPYQTFAELSKKYGDIFSVNLGGYRAIVLSSYEAVKDALKEENFTGRPQFPFTKQRSNNHGLLFSEGASWKELRRFTLRHLRDLGLGKSVLERVIQEEIQELIESLKKKVDQPIMLNNTFNLSIVNALWNLTTGKRFDLEDCVGRQLIEQINRGLARGDTFRVLDLIPGVFYLRGFPEDMLTDMKNNRLALRAMIEGQRKVHVYGDTSNLIHVFLNKMQEDEESGKPSPFTGEEGLQNLIICTLDLFVAGSETTSTTLLYLFRLLAQNPEIQEKVHQELDTAVGKDRLPSWDDRSSLPYTEAVLMECHRYATILPLSLLHSSLTDTSFKGYTIPKDTVIIPNLYQVLRDPKTWARPEEFYPEHFLTPDGKVKHMEELIPFSSGKRICLGEGLAKMEFFLFATALLQQFTFSWSDDQPKAASRPSLSVIKSPDPYKIVLTLRP